MHLKVCESFLWVNTHWLPSDIFLLCVCTELSIMILVNVTCFGLESPKEMNRQIHSIFYRMSVISFAMKHFTRNTSLSISSEKCPAFLEKNWDKEQAQQIFIRNETGIIGGWTIYYLSQYGKRSWYYAERNKLPSNLAGILFQCSLYHSLLSPSLLSGDRNSRVQ